MATIQGNLADGKPMKKGGFYNGQVYDGQKLLAAGVDLNGNQISNEVIGQTNPNNVQYINDLRGSVNLGLPSGQPGGSSAGLNAEVDVARKALQETLRLQKEEADKKVAELRKKETETLDKVGELVTPFREDLENAERKRLHIDENFEANQTLTNELDVLLTQGNELIKQQQSVTGLSSIRNPRVQQTMNDITARTGVIQAVMNARNSQISVAENMIDRSIGAINADRQDQINYYQTILNLNRQDILSLDETSKTLAGEQLNILKTDLSRAQETADYVKKLLIDPSTAQLMGDAGVTLNDSVEQINAKIKQASYVREVAELSNKVTADGAVAVLSPAGVPAGRLITLTDSRGGKHYYQAKADKVAGGKQTEQDYAEMLKDDAQSGATLDQLFALYAGTGLSQDQILYYYNSAVPAEKRVTDVSKYSSLGVTQPKKEALTAVEEYAAKVAALQKAYGSGK